MAYSTKPANMRKLVLRDMATCASLFDMHLATARRCRGDARALTFYTQCALEARAQYKVERYRLARIPEG